MDVKAVLKSQYHGGLKTLRLAVEKCPEGMWDDPADGWARFWRVAYHTLFFTHYYLQKDNDSFARWAKHREEANFIGRLPWEGNREPKACAAYTREEILEYWGVCDGAVDALVEALDLEAGECGFPWYKMGKLEHQIVNIRHVQHHAAILSARLRKQAGIGIEWVAKG
jgi:hypothetical protein